MRNIVRKSVEIKHTKTQRFGGYVQYWKLVFNNRHLPLITFPWISYRKKSIGLLKMSFLYLSLLVKHFYWLFLKPMGSVIHRVTVKTGVIQHDWENGFLIKIQIVNPKVRVRYYLFRKIPVYETVRTQFKIQEILDVLSDKNMSIHEKVMLKRRIVKLMTGIDLDRKMKKHEC